MFKTQFAGKIFSAACLAALLMPLTADQAAASSTVKKYYDVGKSYLVNQKYEMAVKEFNGALRLQPDNVDVLIERGTAFNGQGKYDLALADFEKAIRLSPANYLAYNNRGVTYFRTGNYPRALSDFDKAIAIAPKQPVAYLNRAGASLCAGSGLASAQKIEKWLSDTGWKNPYSGHAAVLAAFCYRQAKADKAAGSLVEEALKNTDRLKWPYPVLRLLAGTLKGKEVLEKAEESDYETTQAHCFLALDLILKGEPEAADIHLKWAAQHGLKNSVECWIARGLMKSPK